MASLAQVGSACSRLLQSRFSLGSFSAQLQQSLTSNSLSPTHLTIKKPALNSNIPKDKGPKNATYEFRLYPSVVQGIYTGKVQQVEFLYSSTTFVLENNASLSVYGEDGENYYVRKEDTTSEKLFRLKVDVVDLKSGPSEYPSF